MTNVNIYEAKSRLSHLLRLVAEGEEVVISKSGHPIARLVAFVPSSSRQPGRLQGQGRVPVGFFEPLPEDLQAYFG